MSWCKKFTYILFTFTYLRGHSIETATIRVFSDLLDAVDRGDTAALVLLDLSAAFDTVDHEILLERLRVTFGVDSSALSWFRSYLASCKQHVRCGGNSSPTTVVVCGVPQGSVLGLMLFIIYTADLAVIVVEHGLSLHQYADDSQIYGSCPPVATSSLSTDISLAVDNISSWMRSNRLQLNADKTEMMWCASARRQSQLPRCPMSVAGASVEPVSAVRDLGIYIDSDLGAATHVRRTLCHAASLHYGSFAIYVDTSPMTVSVLLWCRSCIRRLTMATSYLSDFLPTFNGVFKPYSTLQFVWCSVFVATTT